jgi:DNA (cytosine-5)-methyltransferase 1
MQGLIIDSFAGGGGASTGIEWALNRSPDFAINHSREALAMHAANHPLTVHLEENVWKVDPFSVTKGAPVFLLWASPDCRHHSKAKGGAPVSRSVRGLADVVILWAKVGRPQIIALENVEEFQDWGPLTEAGLPCQARKGTEFGRWVRALEAEGYAVGWWQLRACDYGAPTIRKRLFVVARRDGKPIIKPAPTHGDPKSEAVKAGKLKPWRTAAEIIDWTTPCPSIFLTRPEAKAAGLNIIRPLADKTLARIARGFKRYVLDRPAPFIVSIAHGESGGRREYPLTEPHKTVTSAANAHGLVVPHLMTMRNSGKPFTAADEPAHTVTAGGAGLSVVEGALAPFVDVNRFTGSGQPADHPLPTITANSFVKRPGAGGPLSAVSAALAPLISHAQQGGRSRDADAPLHTVCASTKDQNQAVVGMLVPRYGERAGQEPRSRDIAEPTPTIVPTGNGGDLAAVYLAQHNGNGVIGRDPAEPLSTVTTSAANQQPVMAYLAGVGGRMGQSGERPVEAPYHTVCTKPDTVIVLPHLTAYYGTGDGAPSDEPMRTATTHDRFGHVEAAGSMPPLAGWQIDRARMVAAFLRSHGFWDEREFVTVGEWIVWDIGMRMLSPRELARAQGFPDDYILAAPCGGKPLTETAQRHKIGNSVCPHVAEAVIRANCIEALAMPNVRRRRATVPHLQPTVFERPSFLEAAE